MLNRKKKNQSKFLKPNAQAYKKTKKLLPIKITRKLPLLLAPMMLISEELLY